MERSWPISSLLTTNRNPKSKYAKAKVMDSFGHEDEVDRAVLGRLAKSCDSFPLTHESYPKVREECERLMLGHFSSKNRDFSQRIELTDKQTQLFAALGLKLPPKILCIHPRT